MSSTARRSAALGAGVAGGLALVALVIPQLISTLGPTALGTALVTILLGLVASAGQRLLELRALRAGLESALAIWPPTTLRGAAMTTLGVYPAPGADGGDHYRSRGNLDDDLRTALTDVRTVIVSGPAGAGKSRAARRAAREVLPEVPVIVPVDADALRSLADGTLTIDLPGDHVCLWLDGLDRFIDALDDHALRSLESSIGPTLTIVATIRNEQWNALTTGLGQSTESARALANQAREVELPPLPATGEPSAPDDREPAGDGRRTARVTPKPFWRDIVSEVLAGLAVLTAVLLVIFGVDQKLFQPASIDDQIAAVTSDVLASDGAGEAGAHVVFIERAQLHQTDQPSVILVDEDRGSDQLFNGAVANGGGGPPPRSDELRIYDVIDGRLRLELSFRPAATGPAAGAFASLGADGPAGGIYQNGLTPEFIAGYTFPDANASVLPFAIEWDGRYRIFSLTPTPPLPVTRRLSPAAARFRQAEYGQPQTLADAAGDPATAAGPLTGYRTQAFAVVTSPMPRLLTASYVAPPPPFGSTAPRVLQLQVNQLRDGEPAVIACASTNPYCPAPAREQDLIAPQSWSLSHALISAWTIAASRWTPAVRVLARPVAGR